MAKIKHIEAGSVSTQQLNVATGSELSESFDVVKPRMCFVCREVQTDVYEFGVGNRKMFEGRKLPEKVALCEAVVREKGEEWDLHGRVPDRREARRTTKPTTESERVSAGGSRFAPKRNDFGDSKE